MIALPYLLGKQVKTVFHVFAALAYLDEGMQETLQDDNQRKQMAPGFLVLTDSG